VKELMEVPVEKGQRGRGERILHPPCITLMTEFRARVQKWHDEHDRLNTFKGLMRDQSGTRNGEKYFRWGSLTKVFPAGTAGKASRGPELEYRSANQVEYGDVIKIIIKGGGGGAGRQQVIRGHIKYIETTTEDKPHSGGCVFIHRMHRPTRALGEGPFKVEQIMWEARKETQAYIDKEDKAARLTYPHSLSLSRRLLGEHGGDQDFVLGNEVLRLARDELEAMTIVVDLMDGHNKRLPWETELTKIKLSYIYVQVAVYRDHSNPQQRQQVPFDENSPHVLIRYNQSSRGEGGRYVLQAELFEGWRVFDRPGRYVMALSLYYDMSDPNTGVPECAQACDRVKRELKFEILSGTPRNVTFELVDSNLWFGIGTGHIKMVFAEGSGAAIDPRMLNIDAVFWSIKGRTGPQQMRVNVAQGQYVVEGFTVQEGWFLGGSEQTETLEFLVRFRMHGQERVLELTFSTRIVIKSGLPEIVTLANEDALLKLEPGKAVVSDILVLDKWGNNVRGSQRRILRLVTKSKCLDRNRPREKDFVTAPMTMDLGTVSASFGDGGKLQIQCTIAGLHPIETSINVKVLSIQLCFLYLAPGQSSPQEDAIGTNLTYSAAETPAKVVLRLIEPKTGTVELVSKKIKLTLKRSTVTDFVTVDLVDGESANLIEHMCPQVNKASGTYVATSEDGMLSATLSIKILPTAPTNLLIRNAANLTLRMGQPFSLGFDVVDSRNVVYTGGAVRLG
jgi:hypothetical protein